MLSSLWRPWQAEMAFGINLGQVSEGGLNCTCGRCSTSFDLHAFFFFFLQVSTGVPCKSRACEQFMDPSG